MLPLSDSFNCSYSGLLNVNLLCGKQSGFKEVGMRHTHDEIIGYFFLQGNNIAMIS
jgi:hypothetical protein